MKNSENGFTLIEVLIAIAVLSIGILAMQAMQGISIEENSKSSSISNKSNLAASRIEQIINLDYGDPSLDDTDGDGTGQDISPLDGRDDDDDGDPNTMGVNEEFGLRHWQCWDNGGVLQDAFGVAVPGCIRVADHAAVFEDFAIYWNVADNQPSENTKTINIIVVDPGDPFDPNRMPELRAEYTYVKADII
jgi:prepilin-type N-terminal cleavage/methylation domain-containing protein